MTDEQKVQNFEHLKKWAENQAKVLTLEIEGMIDVSMKKDFTAVYSYGLISNDQLDELLEILNI